MRFEGTGFFLCFHLVLSRYLSTSHMRKLDWSCKKDHMIDVSSQIKHKLSIANRKNLCENRSTEDNQNMKILWIQLMNCQFYCCCLFFANLECKLDIRHMRMLYFYLTCSENLSKKNLLIGLMFEIKHMLSISHKRSLCLY